MPCGVVPRSHSTTTLPRIRDCFRTAVTNWRMQILSFKEHCGESRSYKVRVHHLQPSSSVSLAHVEKPPNKKIDIDVVHLPFSVAVNKSLLAVTQAADAGTEEEGQDEEEPDDRRHRRFSKKRSCARNQRRAQGCCCCCNCLAGSLARFGRSQTRSRVLSRRRDRT